MDKAITYVGLDVHKDTIAVALTEAGVAMYVAGVVTALRACGVLGGRVSPTRMNKISYSGYRFHPEIIQQAIWLHLRFTLSLCDVEDLLAERGVAVSYETVRRWVNHFGQMIAADLRKRRLKPHTTWHLDEVYLKINGGWRDHILYAMVAGDPLL